MPHRGSRHETRDDRIVTPATPHASAASAPQGVPVEQPGLTTDERLLRARTWRDSGGVAGVEPHEAEKRGDDVGVERAPGLADEMRERDVARTGRRRYGRSEVSASKTSATATMRAPSGMASPASPSG